MSIDARARSAVQVVLVDDGSNPPLLSTTSDLLLNQDIVITQENRGRAAALRAGLLAATGKYAVLMDSDDEFIPEMLDVAVDRLERDGQKEIGVIFETADFETGQVRFPLPRNQVATLLGLRADFGVRGDQKEIVRTELMLSALYPDPGSERRVPTSYIWAGVSELGEVLTVHLPLVRHRYLAGGMTKSIRKLKRDNPYWLARTYLRFATASDSAYNSAHFRLLSATKALGVRNARLTREELAGLRNRVGWLRYGAARIAGSLLRIWGLRK